MTCEIISTGSKHGNAVLLNGSLLFDCGVSFQKLSPYLKQISIVFLTHRHCDHFNLPTIRKLHRRRPMIRFVCGKNLLTDLVCKANVSLKNIILVTPEDAPKSIPGAEFHETVWVSPFHLIHDVENIGYIVRIEGSDDDGTAMYATDTHHLPIPAPGLDLYMVEANFRQEDMQQRIAQKATKGEFAYEGRVMESHMSMETALQWLTENADPLRSKIVFLHGHIDENEVCNNGMDRTAPVPERT